MHRDLRWDDVARTVDEDSTVTKDSTVDEDSTADGNCFLLDLELCGVPGKPKFGRLVSWSDGILADGIHYTEASDVRALGMMLQALNVVVSADGLSCLADMCNAESGQHNATWHVLPADQALQHDWLHCRGNTCKFASSESSTM